MTLPATITPQGMQIPTVQDLLGALAADQRATVDPLILTTPDSLVGGYNATFASHLREAYEAIQTTYDSLDPSNATDQRLDAVSEITGTLRHPQQFSTLRGTRAIQVNLNAGVTLPAGSLCNVLNTPSIQFSTDVPVTNSGAVAATLTVNATCTQAGAISANAGTLTVISTPLVGWNSVTNPFDAILGAPVEQDTALRTRREQELRATGTGNPDAIRARLIAMVDSTNGTNPIIDAQVLENTGDVAANGVPPHSIECVVWDGIGAVAQNQDVVNTIFAAKAGGVGTSGSVSGTATDTSGNVHTIKFSRPTQRTVSINVTLFYDTATYAGDTAVQTAIANAFQTGLDANLQNARGTKQRPAMVVSFSAYMRVAQSVAGVNRIELWAMHLDGGGFANWTDMAIGSREIAITNTAAIAITSSAG